MELSSLTGVTSSSTRGAETRNGESRDTANAPFADVMQRAAVAEKPQRSEARGESSASRTAGAQETREPTPAGVAAEQTAPNSRQSDSEIEPGRDPGPDTEADTDTSRILQALEQGDMSGLHAVLASLSGKTGSKDTDSASLSSGQDSRGAAESLDATDLASLFATLSLTVNAQPATGSETAGTNGAATLATGSPALQQVALTLTEGARNAAAMVTGELPDDADHPGASSHARTTSTSGQAGVGGLLSAIDVTRGGNPGSGQGLATANGQGLPLGDAGAVLTGALADPLAANGNGGDPDNSAFSNSRFDPGSLANLTSSPSNTTGLSSSAAQATTGTLTTPVQSPQWPASFGQQILQMHQRGDQQMSLRLHPQELGPISVSLTVQDQQAQLQILSAHAPVRAAVEAAIPQLRQALADSGIALGEAMVGDQGQFQQGQSPNDEQPRQAPNVSGQLLATSGVDSGDNTMLRQVAMSGNGNINLYA
ncbi:flagellar hook-length control protein FliK [Salinicola socius]|uniref:Flagellar hook-length control protein-like C-terminal domain-containing protein n=1 Tax=Salinicola socius TaxID=404433 RepID=A0A1Q8SVX7_9GAMM|nr:flagellar hook-length control protein FliK [Salinicola socius]OLO05573.1 hypothetical protein BTW07_03630 [Salinicola socius]